MSQAEAPPAAQGTNAPVQDPEDRVFREEVTGDAAFERSLLFKEIGIITIIGLLVLLREMFL